MAAGGLATPLKEKVLKGLGKKKLGDLASALGLADGWFMCLWLVLDVSLRFLFEFDSRCVSFGGAFSCIVSL